MGVAKRFGVLRFISNLLKVLAWIILALSMIAAIALVVTGSNIAATFAGISPLGEALFQSGGGIVAGIGLLFLGLIYFLIFYAAGEGIQAQLAIEENTRLTAALLLRMHEETRPQEAEETYLVGGFATEPFEPPQSFE
ncbi:MAG: hypothetical protein KDD92_01670 [Caldilineaceae bacterium]|nr:hypothetical protein [Caldilineaceae bacterium]